MTQILEQTLVTVLKSFVHPCFRSSRVESLTLLTRSQILVKMKHTGTFTTFFRITLITEAQIMVRNKMENCLKWGSEFLNFAITAFLFAAVVYITCRL
jgi:hypothetical protein